MKRIKLFILLFCLLFIYSNANAVDFYKYKEGVKSLDNLCSEMADTNTQINSYIFSKYGIKDYRKGAFKFKLCGSEIQNCYASRNDKYFVNDQKFLSK